MPNYQTVEVPRGRFIGWGKKGQVVTVRVTAFDPTGGSDFNRKPCPQLVGTLVESTTSYREKKGDTVDLSAGELVTVTAGIYSLKMGLLQADPKPGDYVRMEYEGNRDLDDGNTVKDIKVQIARGDSDAVSEDDV